MNKTGIAKKKNAAGSLVLLIYISLLVPILYVAGAALMLFNEEFARYYTQLLIAVGIAGLTIMVLFIVLFVRNTISAVKLFADNDTGGLLKTSLFVKLSLIPYFVINFILNALIFTVLAAASRGIGIILVPIPVFLTYCILLSTSTYSIALVLSLGRNGKMGKRKTVLHFILQICFVLDILSILLLKGKMKK
jgi:hypothetical protein